MSTAPTGMLQRRALMAAGGAPSPSSELIAQGVWSPPDDRYGTGDRRRVPAPLAIEPEPGRGAVQIAENRGGTRRLHGR